MVVPSAPGRVQGNLDPSSISPSRSTRQSLAKMSQGRFFKEQGIFTPDASILNFEQPQVEGAPRVASQRRFNSRAARRLHTKSPQPLCRTQHEHILHEKSESVQLPRPRPLIQIAASPVLDRSEHAILGADYAKNERPAFADARY